MIAMTLKWSVRLVVLAALVVSQPLPHSDAQEGDAPPKDDGASTEKGDDAGDADAERIPGERLFNALDRNNDGELTKSEFPRRLRAQFETYDGDGDGVVTLKEFGEAVKAALGGGRRNDSPSDDAAATSSGDWGPYYADDGFLYQSIAKPYELDRKLTHTLENDERQVDVRITWPKLDAANKDKLPLIVFSHGAGGSKNFYLDLIEPWAAAGYIVIQPTHEDSVERHQGGAQKAMEMVNDPAVRTGRVADIALILDSLGAIQKDIPALKDRIDTDAIGVAGHSFGAFTTMQLMGMKEQIGKNKDLDLSDVRVKAFITLSPQGTDNRILNEKSWENCERPWLTMSGTLDTTRNDADATTRRTVFEHAPQGGKYEVWIEGAAHASFSGRNLPKGNAPRTGEEDAPDEVAIFSWISSASLAFWDGHLRKNLRGRGYLGSQALQLLSEGKVEVNRKAGAINTPDEASFKAANDYSLKCGGHSLLVMVHGKVIHEAYADGYSADKATRLASGTKSFWGVIAQIAIDEKLFTLDELACDTLTEWKEDKQKSKITIRHLLNLTSGLEPGNAELQGPTRYSKYERALTLKMNQDAGEKFEYGGGHFFAFGELMHRKLAKQDTTLDDYLKTKLLEPMGLEVKLWTKDTNGEPHLPHGAYLTAPEWAKFGELIRNHGKVGDKQIVSAEALRECFHGSEQHPGYGLTFWLLGGQLASMLPHDAVMAAGKGKQRLYIVPSLDMVIVRQGEDSRPAFEDTEFLKLLLAGLE